MNLPTHLSERTGLFAYPVGVDGWNCTFTYDCATFIHGTGPTMMRAIEDCITQERAAMERRRKDER